MILVTLAIPGCARKSDVLPHVDKVLSVSVSPDGTLVATGSVQTARIWESNSRKLLDTFDPGYLAWCLAFSPDGRVLAVGTDNKRVCLWDVRERRELRTLTGHTDRVWCLAFSPDGSLLATGSHDRTIGLWATNTWELLRTIPTETTVNSLVFSPDGQLIATGEYTGEVKLYNADDGSLKRIVGRHIDEVASVSFRPDGQFIASACHKDGVKLWSATEEKQTPKVQLPLPWVTRIAFSPDGKRLAASVENEVRLIDPMKAETIFTYGEHSDYVNAIAFSPDGTWLVSGGRDRTARIWTPQSR